MNFQTILEELDRLYEEDRAKVEEEVVEETAEEVVEEEAVKEELTEEAMTEAADDEEEIEIVEDEEAEEAPVEEVPAEEVNLVLECANCGAIMVKAEADVVVDEETGMANVDEACQYCEAVDGHKILGVVAPYGADVEEPAEEVAEEPEAEEVVEDEIPVED